MQNVKVYYMPNSNDSFVRECDADKAIKEAIDMFADEMKKMCNGIAITETAIDEISKTIKAQMLS